MPALSGNMQGLINCLLNDNYKVAKQYARCCLLEDKTQKNENFVKKQLEKMNNYSNLINTPDNISKLVYIERPYEELKVDRIYISNREKSVVDDIVRKYTIAKKLEELDIPYRNATLLYGESGTGKTTFARYVAYVMKLPLIYLNFSTLIDSLLGGTSKNIKSVFDFCRNNDCVLMLDEIDCVASTRNTRNDVAESNRITISLMQELDRISNDLIIIGATNIVDSLDPAVLRRFSTTHKVEFLNLAERKQLVEKYFASLHSVDSITIEVKDEEKEELAKTYLKQNELVEAIINTISKIILKSIT